MSNPRIIHFIPDEKVTNNFILILEKVYPGESYYAVYGKSKSMQRTKSNNQNVHYFNINSKEFSKLIKNLSGYERVFLHSISPLKAFNHLKHPDIIIIFWGSDLYESLICHKGYKIYIDEEEQFAVRAANSPIGNIPIYLYRFLVWIRDTVYFRRLYKLLKKSKSIISIDCDYLLLQKYFPELNKLQFRIPFSYYPIEKQIGANNLNNECIGHNIWVGNSPALNGNHTSIFKKLSNYSSNTKIYVPISYGEERLKKFIDIKGKEILGNKFFPIKTFMPAEKYFELYLDANAFIFGHLRQCGEGSLSMAIYLGGKCFLYKKNPLYNELKNKGIILFSIDEDLNEDFAKKPLSKEERIHNKNIITSISSSKAIENQIKIVFAN